MKKIIEKLKNKKVLALYLVGVLLLSSGLSYAFFTATSSVSGSGSISSVDTATITSEGIAGDGNISFSESDIYPGHTAIASIKVTGTGENTPLLYNVIFEGTNTFTTPINYTIYKLDQNIEVSYSCTPTTKVVSGAMMYYEECSGNNITSLGSPIKSGTINNGKTTLLDNEVIITSSEGTITYYYVVIEYPNQNNEQNADIGSTLSGTIKVESNGEYPKPEVLFVGNTTQGSNGWYKNASITSNITSYTEDYEVEYCTTTSETCTPNTTPTLSDNSFTINLDNNSSEQKVCVRITDGYNQIGEGCSLGYKIDGENPSVTITNETVDKTSIKVTVNGSDSYSGITSYKFSKDNGSNYETINTSEDTYTYTFNNLESGTEYPIKVQVIDEAGNIGEISKEISTQADSAGAYILASENAPTGQTTDWTGQTTYYYTGANPNNWVYFAGFYWRIIRINGDGSIRMIYQGTSANTTGTGTRTGTSAFNSDPYNKTYVGLVYDGSTQHGSGSPSTIMTNLNNWYNSNLASYEEQYIDTGTGFCSDRNMASGYNFNSGGTIYYAPYDRQSSGSLQCHDDDVLSQDNGKIPNPIGLLTSDEYVLAGKADSYLDVGIDYWTMSPRRFYDGWASVFHVDSGGGLGSSIVDWAVPGVRPVINLKSAITITGEGNIDKPFKVQ
ncbi:MAG TPA: fibronectin type III domain-containing protein [Candidatus Caccenecus avistercoris]|nr:fibronectin type III domain-containing protein [Candidatus Caccenecus avistercoris]